MNRTRAFASLALTAALTLALAAAAFAQSRTPDPLAPPATTIADTVPPPPGAPNLAWLSSLEIRGEVADSLRMAFMSTFRGAFAEGAYATERTRDGRPAPSLPASARFRLIEGTSGWGVWNLQVVVSYLPSDSICELPVNNIREAEQYNAVAVVVAALPPSADGSTARPIPARTNVVVGGLLHCRITGGPQPGQRETTVAWFRLLGRTTALLALEHLHHLIGDLDEDTQLALGPAWRVEVWPEPADPGVKPAKKRKAERY